MSNIEEKFQAFLKESLSTEDSSSSTTIPSSKHGKKDTTSDTPSQKTFWWLKGSVKLDDGSSSTIQQTNIGLPPEKKQANLSTHSSVSSSMAEFLEKEKMCKEGSKTSLVERNTISGSLKVDTSPNVDYTDDFTDDDISSIMDQLSQLAGSSNLDDSGKSVDEILREAEEVVRESSRNFRGNSSKYRTLIQTSSKELSPDSDPPPLSMPSLQLVRKKDNLDQQDPKTNMAINPQEENSVSNKSPIAMTDTETNSVPLIHHGNVIGTADVIFQLIDEEVQNEVAAAKEKKSFSDGKINDETSVNESNADDEGKTIKFHPDASSSQVIDDEPTNVLKSTAKKVESSKVVPFLTSRGEPLSIVLEESLSEASIGSSTKTANKVSELLSDEGSHKDGGRYTDLEKELAKERQKYKQLKDEIVLKESDHKLQMELLKRKTEEDRFAIEKDVYLLRAKLTDLEEKKTPFELGGGDCNSVQLANDHRLKLLESEIQKQEKLIIGYQHENVKLCQDMKQLKVGICVICL